MQFIRDLDLEYSKRRLQFVLSGVSWLYRDLGTEGTPTRQQLDAVKERLSVAVGKLEWLSSGAGFAAEVLDGVSTCFGEERLRKHLERHRFDTASFLREHADELDSLNEALRTFVKTELTTFTPDLYRDLLALTAHWPEGEATTKIRRDLLIRYLAFPIWDALLYPLQAYTDVNERDAVRVARMSPVDSTLLKPVGAIKVLGAQLGHAYAFFSLKARENDYLWGRLDAAERMVRLLLSETTSDGRFVSGLEHTDYKRWCKRVFDAILEEEKAHLPTIADDVEALVETVASASPSRWKTSSSPSMSSIWTPTCWKPRPRTIASDGTL